MKLLGTVFFSLALLCVVVLPSGVSAQQPGSATLDAAPTLHFFYSDTCPHCRAEKSWLASIESDYPQLTIQRYSVTDDATLPLMQAMLRAHGAERYFGTVPLTFVGGEFFVGFDTPRTTGREIEAAIREELAGARPPQEDVPASDTVDGAAPSEPYPDADSAPLSAATDGDVRQSVPFRVPLIGEVDPSRYSLPVLALVLGFLDGFNVCSLGALVMIIGLTLKLQRRRAIILFGGSFVLVTALVYGGLIVLWYQLFASLGQYLGLMKVAIMLLSLGGGLYFFKEYLRMRKQGATCELSESPLIARLTARTAHAFTDKTTLLSLLGLVALFAAVVAVVEFPCSAAVPVAFAALLADAGVSTVAYLSYIGLFVFMYLLDELIIFGIAAWRLKLWMSHGSFTKWAVLGEAFVLVGIGLWYLYALV